MRFIDADKLYDTIQADKGDDAYWIEIDGVLELIEKQETVHNDTVDAYKDGYRTAQSEMVRGCWTSVLDELPETPERGYLMKLKGLDQIPQRYLVAIQSVDGGYFYEVCMWLGYWQDDRGYRYPNVEYWMPIPA